MNVLLYNKSNILFILYTKGYSNNFQPSIIYLKKDTILISISELPDMV